MNFPVLFAGACLVTSGLMLHICVAAMWIWKPPAKFVSKAGKTEAESLASSAERVFVSPVSTGKNGQNALNSTASSEELTDDQVLRRDNSIGHHTITILSNRHFQLLLINNFLAVFGTSMIFTHLTAYAKSQGKSTGFGNLMLPVVGASSILGRIILNALCQQQWVNSITLYIVAATLCGKI